MNRATLAALFGLSAALLVGAASAQTADNAAPPATTPPATVPATVPVSDQANTQATTATATADAKLAAIQARARATSEKDRKSVEPKLDASKASVDKEAAAKGDNVVAGRLATEFSMTPDALTGEKAQFNTGWGDLMIAHSLLANAKSDVTLDQIFQMRTDGMGWGQIANGLGLRMGEVVSAVASEGRVATGQSKPDGKVATIHSGDAAGAHSASAHSHAAPAARAGMGAGAGSMKGHSGK
jgi:hypothetical protein